MDRISDSYMTSKSVNYLNKNLLTSSKLQEQLASGKNINRASDDPVGLTRLLSISNTLSTDDRYSKNIDSANSELSTTDSVMTNMVGLIQRAQELTTNAANFTNDQNGRDAISKEIDSIMDQMVQLGNTEINGRYIFGGAKTDSAPFTRTGDDVAYTGTPTTSTWQRSIAVADGSTVTVNTNGQNLLGSVSVVSTGPPLPATYSPDSSGIFKTLADLKNNLAASTDTNQLSEIQKRLDDLTDNMNNVLTQQSTVGAVTNRLELTQSRIDERKSIFTQQYSSIQNVDQPTLITQLDSQENVLQASLSVTAKVLQDSLLKYL